MADLLEAATKVEPGEAMLAKLREEIEEDRPLKHIVENSKDMRERASAICQLDVKRLERIQKTRPLTFVEHEALDTAREVLWDQKIVENRGKELKGMAIGLAIAPSLMAAPGAMAISVASSMGANYVAKEVALACGTDQGTADKVGVAAGLVAGGAAGLVRAPIATLVHTAVAVGAEKGTEAVLIKAGVSAETAKDVGEVVGAWTPLVAGKKVDRILSATGSALKTSGKHVADVASRLEVKLDPHAMSCGGFGGAKVSLKPKVEISSAALPMAQKPATATWVKPMEVTPTVKIELPVTTLRPSTVGLPHAEPARHVPRVHTEPVMRPTTQTTTTDTPLTLCSIHMAPNPVAKLVPTVTESAAGGAEATVLKEPVRLTTAADRVRDNPMLMKDYVQHMERITELDLHPSQLTNLKDVLRTTIFEKLSKDAADAHRAVFDSIKPRLRTEWETNTGKTWPVYDKDYLTSSGVPWKKKGRPYDAHHIIQSDHGGPNEWWNIHPAHGLEHHPKIHGAGAPAREIFIGPKKGTE